MHETNPETVGREELQDVAYDPFELMPAQMPDPPRVCVSSEDVKRVAALAQDERWARVGLERLREAAARSSDLPDELGGNSEPELRTRVLRLAEHNALAHLLTGEEAFLARALACFRLFTTAYLTWPINDYQGRTITYSLGETRVTCSMAMTFDMLAPAIQDSDDAALFREGLNATREVNDLQEHFYCGNHNTWSNVARLSVGLALGDLQEVHDALYGCDRGRKWRYGLVHHLRHDFFAEGLHWERAPGYHFYTLMGLA